VPNLSDKTSAVRLRSILFAPGNSERKLRRALDEPADAVVADLEDSVPAAEKAEARAIVADVLASAPTGCARFVRVNGADTGLLEEDIASLDGLGVDGIVLPKAEPDALRRVGSMPVIAIVETARGMTRARAIASGDVVALMLGAVDLGLELRLLPRRDGAELAFFRSALVLESAAACLGPPVDGVYVDTRDLEGLEEESLRARTFGMGGKACIHPSQVPIVNRVFSPSAEELEHAHRVVEAYERARAAGSGAVALEGRMIDLPVVEQARRMLADEGLLGPKVG
jgi:citrate lyase subunit beta / citryl-CoA lyase